MRTALFLGILALSLAPLAFADGQRGQRPPPGAMMQGGPSDLVPGETRGPSGAPSLVPAGHEAETYRHGSTYAFLPGSDAIACETRCAGETSCTSWSFIAAYGAGSARCELKRAGGRAEHNPLATSGISPRLIRHETRVVEPEPEQIPADRLLGEPAIISSGTLVVSASPVMAYSIAGPASLP